MAIDRPAPDHPVPRPRRRRAATVARDGRASLRRPAAVGAHGWHAGVVSPRRQHAATAPDPTDRPPLRLVEILRTLAAWQVDWVLTGSTVLAVYGAELVPNDVDVTPSLAPDNLRRLAEALTAIGAVPAYLPDWPTGPSLAQCRQWTPWPPTERHLDHLFVTRLGMVDVPPRLCGSYDELLAGATRVDVAGVQVYVCALGEVLDRLDGRTRTKDRQRADVYARMRRLARGRLSPDGVPGLLRRLSDAGRAG